MLAEAQNTFPLYGSNNPENTQMSQQGCIGLTKAESKERIVISLSIWPQQ
jgi:hypothetical protein